MNIELSQVAHALSHYRNRDHDRPMPMIGGREIYVPDESTGEIKQGLKEERIHACSLHIIHEGDHDAKIASVTLKGHTAKHTFQFRTDAHNNITAVDGATFTRFAERLPEKAEAVALAALGVFLATKNM